MLRLISVEETKDELATLQTLATEGAISTNYHEGIQFLSLYSSLLFKDQRPFLAHDEYFDNSVPRIIKINDPMIFVGNAVFRFAARLPPSIEGHAYPLFSHMSARAAGLRSHNAQNNSDSLDRIRRAFFDLMFQANKSNDQEGVTMCLAQAISVLDVQDLSIQSELLALVSEAFRELHLFHHAYSIECMLLSIIGKDVADPPFHGRFPTAVFTSRDAKAFGFLLSLLERIEQFEQVQGDLLFERRIVHRCQRAVLIKQFLGEQRAVENEQFSDHIFLSVLKMASQVC